MTTQRQDDEEPTATWLMAQSTDEGATITYSLACWKHAETWWEGADWDGSTLDREIRTTQQCPHYHG